MICVYKCVCCGDQMHYSIRRKMLVCDTCGGECEIENYDIDCMTYEGQTSLHEDIETFSCPTCGARVAIKNGSAKFRCSYCHSELTAFGVRKDELSPEKIIPCKLTYNEARGKLLSWWLSHETMPKFDEKKLDVKFQDVYVPVWLINADATSTLKADIAPYDYNNYNLPHDVVQKTYATKYLNVPFDSSCHILDDQFYNVEPFHYSEMQDFDPSYLSGHSAECYHIEPNLVLPRAVRRLKGFAKDQSRESMEIATRGKISSILYEETDVTPQEITYLLVPLWVCTYTYHGKKYNVYINGQTGKTDGEVIFAGTKFQRDLIFYGISNTVLGLPLAFVCLSLMMIASDMRSKIGNGALSFYLMPFVYFFAMLGPLFQTNKHKLIAPVVNANQKNQARNPFTGGIRVRDINQEIQIKQGLKVSALVSGMISLVLGLILLLPSFMFAWPQLHFWGSDIPMCILFSVLGGLAFAAVRTFSFSKLLLFYETYRNKTTYLDYINYYEIQEIDPEQSA